MTGGRQRVTFLVLVGLVLIAGAVVDGVAGRPAPAATAVTVVAPTVVAPANALSPASVSSTAWYCIAGSPASIVLANTSSAEVSGSVRYASGGTARAVSAPAGAQVSVAPPSGAGDGAQAATVVLGAGGVGAAVATARRHGTWDMTSCASETAPVWWFPEGSTVIGSDLEVHVYNPTATAAVVDITAFTVSGALEPPDYQTLEVAPGAMVSERLAQHVADAAVVGVEVAAQAGAVVAEESDTIAIGTVTGRVEELGTPVLSSRWTFPSTSAPAKGDVTFTVLNPSPAVAAMRLSVASTSGVFRPVDFTAAPDALTSFDASSQGGLPLGAPYAATLQATNGARVVVGRTVRVSARRAAPPTIGAVMGDPGGTRSWVVPAAPASSGPVALSVMATGAAAHVSVTALGPGGVAAPVTSAGPVTAPAGGYIVFGPFPRPPIGREVLLVTADEPVSIEFDLGPAAAAGIVTAPAWPAAR